MTLSTALAERISRLIPSLASSFDGEVIATRNAIGRELVAGQSDWFDLATAISGLKIGEGAPSPNPTPSPSSQPHTFGDLARACRGLDRGRLSTRERNFVADMCRHGWNFAPSPRQTAWMLDLYRRLAGERRAA